MATNTSTFTFDAIEELVDQLFDESEEAQNAAITFTDGIIRLTTCEIETCEVVVYQIKESDELYGRMEDKYLALLEGRTSGSDFWDMWSVVLDVLADHKIVDEVFNP